MIDCLLDVADGTTVPIWPIACEDFDNWLHQQPPEVATWVEAAGFSPKRHTTLLVSDRQGEVAGVVLGLGSKKDPDYADPWAFAGLPGTLPGGTYRFDGLPDDRAARNGALGWALGDYSFDRYRTSEEERTPARLMIPAGADRAFASRAAQATYLVRDLINTPAGDLGPAELGEAAQDLAQKHGAACNIVVGEALENGYPAIHAVGGGSPRAPRLIDLTWGNEAHPKVTLVGKGICFDTGGLDVKPSSAMQLMKKDMGGAAHVLGLAHMIMDAGLPVRLRVLIPAAENSVSGRAYRPGDVVRTRKGVTVEIGNTDAEGRLVLADALTLADEESPELLVDFATLTGAARVALGPDLPALFTDDGSLATDLTRIAAQQDDPVWRMPLWRPYAQGLKSKIADLNNISDGPFAGAVTAALFLDHFVSDATSWAHLDVFGWVAKANPGRIPGGEAMAMRAVYALIAERFAE
ncbi:MAG: M17 family metallopeptidase [Sphingomonadales bacterium]